MALSDVRHFTNSTFPDWVLCRHGEKDRWECDGVLINKNWLPGYDGQETEKKLPGRNKKHELGSSGTR